MGAALAARGAASAVGAPPAGASDAPATTWPVYQSLLRAPLWLGVDPRLVTMEGAVAAAVVVLTGAQLGIAAVVVAVVVGFHCLVAKHTAGDALALDLAVRSLRWPDTYDAQPGIRASVPRPRASIPDVR